MTSEDQAWKETACQDLQITREELDAVIEAGFKVTVEFNASSTREFGVHYNCQQTHIVLIESRTNGVTDTMHPHEIDVTHQVRMIIQFLRRRSE